MTEQSLVNHFLLALPNQIGTYFEDTLTFLVRHNDEGAMGFIVNRPMPIKLAELLKEANLDPVSGEETNLWEGGPVSPTHPSIIHSDDFSTDSTVEVAEGIGLTTEPSGAGIYATLKAIAEGSGPKQYMFVLGYAGWAPGQLEGELKENAWVTCPADRKILFDEPHQSKVRSVSSIIGVDFSKFSPQGGMA